MASITVGTNSWADLAAADAYIDNSVQADQWSALSFDAKNRAMITAFRILDRASWAGERTDEAQLTSHPRTGLMLEGQEVDSSAVHPRVIQGQFELALAIGLDASLANSPTGSSASGVKAVGAGSARVEFFNNNPAADIASSRRFPTAVHELISPFLSGSDGIIGGLVTGNEDCSQFEDTPSQLFRGFA